MNYTPADVLCRQQVCRISSTKKLPTAQLSGGAHLQPSSRGRPACAGYFPASFSFFFPTVWWVGRRPIELKRVWCVGPAGFCRRRGRQAKIPPRGGPAVQVSVVPPFGCLSFMWISMTRYLKKSCV